jgi:hypothetical protein
MPPELFFVTALVVLGAALFWTVWLLTRMMSQQERRLTHLLNLAVAKDLPSLSTLSALTSESTGYSEPVSMDPETQARILADHFTERGIDPSLA